MSKLLLDEQPLLVMPQLACKIGLNESLILQQIHYWNQINEKVKNNFKDGYYWTYNSYEDWQKQFPFWSIPTIKRTFAKLEAMGLVVVGNYNRMKIDRTKWYRIDTKMLEKLDSSTSDQFDTMDKVNMIRPIPENKQILGKFKHDRHSKVGKMTEYQLETMADMVQDEATIKRMSV